MARAQQSFAAVAELALACAHETRTTEVCNWYAMVAMQQVRENLSNLCGHRGNGWSTDIRAPRMVHHQLH